jgi:hypothetical protein
MKVKTIKPETTLPFNEWIKYIYSQVKKLNYGSN